MSDSYELVVGRHCSGTGEDYQCSTLQLSDQLSLHRMDILYPPHCACAEPPCRLRLDRIICLLCVFCHIYPFYYLDIFF